MISLRYVVFKLPLEVTLVEEKVLSVHAWTPDEIILCKK